MAGPSTTETVLWIVVTVAVYAAVALAVVDGPVRRRAGWDWLAGVCAVPVAAVIVLSVLKVPAPPHPAFGLTLGVGLALLATVGGSPMVSLVLRLAARSVRLGVHGGILVRGSGSDAAADSDPGATAPEREILRGGTTIGHLERFALVGSVLVGQPAAVAVIVAIKGLGRFSELENAAARERFIIGTLASLTWAGACAAAIVLSR